MHGIQITEWKYGNLLKKDECFLAGCLFLCQNEYYILNLTKRKYPI